MTKFVYPVIGGPLDGQYADYSDWYDRSWDGSRPPGQFHDYAHEYVPFNRGDGGSSKKVGGAASMIWLHKDLLRPLIRRQ